MSPLVYDDEKQDTGFQPDGSHDDLDMDDEQRQAEIDSLEDSFNSPSSDKDNLDEDERNPNQDDASDAEKKESDQIGDGYNENDSKKTKGRSIFRRKPMALIGGGIASIFTGGGLMILPMLGIPNIHLSQLLSTDSYGNSHNADIRWNMIYRYAKSGGQYGQTRVGYVGSKVYAAGVANMDAHGITINEKSLSKAGTISFDLDRNPETKNMTREQARSHLAKKYGVPESRLGNIGGRKLAITGLQNESAQFKMDLFNKINAEVFNGKFSTWLANRVIPRFYGVYSNWHPIKRVANEKIWDPVSKWLDKKERAKSEKDRKKRVRSKQLAEKAKSSAKGLKDNLDSGPKKLASGALMVTGAMCLARSAADDAIAFNRAAIVAPSILEAQDAMSVGAQQQSGMDFDVLQMAAVSDTHTDKDGKTIMAATALKAKGNPYANDGEDIPYDYAQAFTGDGGAKMLSELGGAIGDVACSPGGIVVQVVGGLALLITGPAGNAIRTAGSMSAKAVIAAKTGTSMLGGMIAMVGLQKLITEVLKNDELDYDSLPAPVRGNLMAYGSRAMANSGAILAGGVELSKEESLAIDQQQFQESQEEFKNKPKYAQLFDVYDYRSMAGGFIDKQSTDPGRNVQNMASAMFNIAPTLFSSFKSLSAAISPKVAASNERYDYGFNRYGIPARITDNPRLEDPYAVAERAAGLFNDGQYIDRAKTCFGVSIEKKDDLWTIIPEKDVDPYDKPYMEAKCNASDDENWDAVIAHISNNSVAESYACWEGDSDGCNNIGIENSSSSDSGSALNGSGVSEINVATYNIRADDLGGSIAQTKQAADLMKSEDVAVFGAQEVRKNQFNAIKQSGYDGVVSSPDGRAIFWDSSIFSMKRSGSWMTPKDGKQKPMLWAELSSGNGNSFYIFNMHTQVGAANGSIRTKNANDALSEINKVIKDTSTPFVVVGDMNSNYLPNSNRKEVYGVFKDKLKLAFFETNDRTSADCDTIPARKQECGRRPFGSHNDHIYISNSAEMTVDSWKTIATPETLRISDHNPVIVNLTIPSLGTNSGAQSVVGTSAMGDDFTGNGNCVDFVKFRLKKHKTKYTGGRLGNGMDVARNLGSKFGYKVNNTPAVHAVVSWPKNGVEGSSANSTYGHTAMVSQVNKDGSIVVEEYNYTNRYKYGTRKIPASAAKLLTYAHTEVDYK